MFGRMRNSSKRVSISIYAGLRSIHMPYMVRPLHFNNPVIPQPIDTSKPSSSAPRKIRISCIKSDIKRFLSSSHELLHMESFTNEGGLFLILSTN